MAQVEYSRIQIISAIVYLHSDLGPLKGYPYHCIATCQVHGGLFLASAILFSGRGRLIPLIRRLILRFGREHTTLRVGHGFSWVLGWFRFTSVRLTLIYELITDDRFPPIRKQNGRFLLSIFLGWIAMVCDF